MAMRVQPGRLAADTAYRARPDVPYGAWAVRSPGAGRFLYTERHVQCVWFDSAWRPAALRAADGQAVQVESPGRWNLEEGPDFRDAVLRIGPGRRRLEGDVEVHVHPADWQRHGHAGDPAYARVVAHITYFPADPRAEGPPGAVCIALKEPLAANPFFSFESLDLTAYPYAVRAPAAPCARRLAGCDPDRIATLLEAAGAERVRRKAKRLARAVLDKGASQALYEEVLTALGYKHNRPPFRYLAEHVPLEAVRAESGGAVIKAYALLMGVAGLLPAETSARWDTDTRAWVRGLWDAWWKWQARWGALALPRSAWRLTGLRPHNHPQRRLMLAAVLFAGEPDLAQRLAGLEPGPPDATHRTILGLLQPETDTYWTHRLRLAGPRQPAPVALMGARRAAAVAANAIVPFLAATRSALAREDFLRHLPPEEDNQIIRQTAHALLGPDHNPALYQTGLRQQGLIQIFHDFCLPDRSRCGRCAFPRLLDRLRA